MHYSADVCDLCFPGCAYGNRIRSCMRYIGELGPELVCSRYKKYCCGICESLGLANTTSTNQELPAAVIKETHNTINVLSKDRRDGSTVIVGTKKRKGPGQRRQDKDVKTSTRDRNTNTKLTPEIQTVPVSDSGPVNGILVRSLPMPTIFISRRGVPGRRRWRLRRRFRQGHRVRQIQISGK